MHLLAHGGVVVEPLGLAVVRRGGSATWYGSVATAKEPTRSKSQAQARSRTVLSIASRFSMPRRSSVSSSVGNRASPFFSPWVRLASTKPPLRPLAGQPTRSPSTSTTRLLGSRSFASSAVQSPV